MKVQTATFYVVHNPAGAALQSVVLDKMEVITIMTSMIPDMNF